VSVDPTAAADPDIAPRRRPWRVVVAALAVVIVVPTILIAALVITSPSPSPAPGWVEIAPMPARGGEVASATRSRPQRGAGELYVAGGFAPIASTSDRVSVYRRDVDAWEALPSLPEGRHHAGAAILGGDLFVNGGSGATTSRSPESSHWVLREGAASWEELEPMPEGRWGHRTVGIGGRLFVVGGEGPSARVLIFSEEEGWTAGAELPAARDHLAAVVHRGELWAIGGRNGDGGPLSDVHVYDPRDDQWREGPDLPVPVSAAVEGVIDGEIHLVGGEDPAVLGGGVIDRHLVLRRGAREWEELAAPPLAVHGAAGGAIDGELLVAGGSGRQGALSPLAWTDFAARFEGTGGGGGR
jgi:N-acetylneuraminic acid mutarotase